MDSFHDILYLWYRQNCRELPWRTTRDPYKIWVSEIILQQTRINQGLPYYLRFLEKFPSVFHLADAPEDEILKVWEGLGYYSRARNMHQTAKEITSFNHGIFPSDYKLLCHLKGIGDYTAAAIASIAFNLPYPAIDGNVKRFISRYSGIIEPIDTSSGNKLILKTVGELLDHREPGRFNQALMEFGALQCIPSNPDCQACPFSNTCDAFLTGMVKSLPAKSRISTRRSRYFYFFVIESQNQIILEKRTDKDIWRNLYQLPLFESPVELTPEEILKIPILPDEVKSNSPVVTRISQEFRHDLTHQKIFAWFIHLDLPKLNVRNSRWLKANKKEIHKFAFPVLIRSYLEKYLQGKTKER